LPAFIILFALWALIASYASDTVPSSAAQTPQNKKQETNPNTQEKGDAVVIRIGPQLVMIDVSIIGKRTSQMSAAPSASFAHAKAITPAWMLFAVYIRSLAIKTHFEQLSARDMARLLHSTEVAAGKRYIRAVTRLRRLLLDLGVSNPAR
jgi:hypothetical protein